MQLCEHYQATLALRLDEPDLEREAHLRSCPACAKAARRMETFDTVVRQAVMPAMPAELTARLMALVPGLAAPPVRSARWNRQRRVFMVLCGILSVVAIAVMAYGLYWLAGSLGVPAWLASLKDVPGDVQTWLYQHIPASKSVVSVLHQLYQPLQWALILVLLWLLLDRVSAQTSNKQRLAGS